MAQGSLLIPLPGQSWVSDLNVHALDTLAASGFSLIPCPTSLRFGKCATPEVGVCLSSSDSSCTLRARCLFEQLRSFHCSPLVFSLTLAGATNTPLAAIHSDGREDSALIEPSASAWFHRESIVRDYLSCVWFSHPTNHGGQLESFRLQRNIWISNQPGHHCDQPQADSIPLPLAAFTELMLDERFNPKRFFENCPPCSTSQHAHGIRTYSWSNAQLSTVRDHLVLKELILRPFSGQPRVNPWGDRRFL